MAKVLRIYLPPAPSPDLGKYEVFRDGKRTGDMITNKEVRSLLTRDQYNLFLKGEDIFLVPADKYRTRKHNKRGNQIKKSIKLNRNG